MVRVSQVEEERDWITRAWSFLSKACPGCSSSSSLQFVQRVLLLPLYNLSSVFFFLYVEEKLGRIGKSVCLGLLEGNQSDASFSCRVIQLSLFPLARWVVPCLVHLQFVRNRTPSNPESRRRRRLPIAHPEEEEEVEKCYAFQSRIFITTLPRTRLVENAKGILIISRLSRFLLLSLVLPLLLWSWYCVPCLRFFPRFSIVRKV